jgi:hypothetical protein
LLRKCDVPLNLDAEKESVARSNGSEISPVHRWLSPGPLAVSLFLGRGEMNKTPLWNLLTALDSDNLGASKHQLLRGPGNYSYQVQAPGSPYHRRTPDAAPRT